MNKLIDLNDLFPGADEEIKDKKNESIELNIDDLIAFKNHPFKLYEGDRLNDMVESIKEHGIITPLIVRPLENNKYEILSGHNRVQAGKLAGLKKVPVLIREDLSDEEAMLIVTETNLIQRSFFELSHSEKARILTERHKAMKEKGKKRDLIDEIEMMSNIDGYQEEPDFGQFGQKRNSRIEVASSYDLSPRMVGRYLRIDSLSDDLKKRIDDNSIPFTAGVDLSFLTLEEQEMVEEILDNCNYKMDLKKSTDLKYLSKKRGLSITSADEVLSGRIGGQMKKKKPKFSKKWSNRIIKNYITDERDIKEIEELIEKLLEEYYKEKEEEDVEEKTNGL